MSQRYNFFYFEAIFKKYLVAGNAESSTVKNYLSDLHYFFSWLQNDMKISDLDLSDAPEVFSHNTVRAYNNALKAGQTASSTRDRRLSSLRHFFALCIEQGWLKTNPAHEFDTTTRQDELMAVVGTYRRHLTEGGMAQDKVERHINTIRNLIINL